MLAPALSPLLSICSCWIAFLSLCLTVCCSFWPAGFPLCNFLNLSVFDVQASCQVADTIRNTFFGTHPRYVAYVEAYNSDETFMIKHYLAFGKPKTQNPRYASRILKALHA